MLMLCLLEKRGDFRQHFVHDGFWQGIHLAGVAGSQVDHARLIATHDAGGLDAGHRHGEAQASGERAAVGDRQDHQQLGRLIEFKRIFYNSAILSRLLTKYEASGNAKALALITQMSPAAWRHILLNGHYTFHSDGNPIDLDALVAGLELG